MREIWRHLQAHLQPHSQLAHQVGAFPTQAAVLVLLTNDNHNPEIIFTQRALHLFSHPGEVAFPGGKWEEGDHSLLDTALRESCEEIALSPSQVDIIGACPMRATRAGIKVTPFVGVIAADTPLRVNCTELDAIFRVPLIAFKHDSLCIRTDIFTYDDQRYSVPAYGYQGYEIWGFTAALTQEVTRVIWSLAEGEKRSN